MNRTASRAVFHLPEWTNQTLPDVTLTPADQTLVELLMAEGKRLSIDELRSGLRVITQAWVGVVRFERFDICIEPKLTGDNLGLVEMIAYTAGLDALRRVQSVRTMHAAEGDLFDLLALLLAEACVKVARAGLLADYVAHEEALPAVRGRILADQQVIRQFGRIDRIECRFDEQDTDIAENQILAGALDICMARVKDEMVRRQVRRLQALFAEVCDPSAVDFRALRVTLSYNRLNEYYHDAHDLAWLILDGLGVHDILSSGATKSFAFLIDMNRLFEAFIERVLDALCTRSELRMWTQRKDRSILWDEIQQRPYATVIPDILIARQAGGPAFLPLDAKYKRYDERKVSNDDIYQTMLYALAYGPRKGDHPPQALLLYPASVPQPVESVISVRDMYEQNRGSIRVIGIHLPSLLKEVRDGMSGPMSQVIMNCIDQALAYIQ